MGDGHVVTPLPPLSVCLSPGPRVRIRHLRRPVGARICFRGSPAGTGPPRPPLCAAGSSGKSRRRTRKGSGKGRERKGLFRAVGVGGPAALKPSRCRGAAGGGSRGAGGPGAPGLLHSRTPGLILQPPPARLRGPGEWGWSQLFPSQTRGWGPRPWAAAGTGKTPARTVIMPGRNDPVCHCFPEISSVLGVLGMSLL